MIFGEHIREAVDAFRGKEKKRPETDLKRFDLRVWQEQILEAAEKKGIGHEGMTRLRYNAEQDRIESERKKRELSNLMREYGIK